ncbi:DUF433 domain-containing protein [Pseudoxanthomonas mexicana]|jgi:uncharacterized protein (DUF433 family)/DNA-binding transcriptional MerR regulator|uniref:DUF433 domain-containing protein n=1 Tax=Pseudoxanthomonas mexicana TaxID=128785 RepID=UPI001FD71574|nr:DUF433 domain-containing protein [Pseudoxanthomonas mexicana]UOV02882.1 DUF433 domain-containing protein [Pseudoxanthomonas mexicana]
MGIPVQSQSAFGVGVYSFADAARFIGAKPRELRRWALGYSHKSRNGDAAFSSPLWQTQLASTDIEGVGFKDLIELRFVHAFRDEGVSMQVIRRTLQVARDRFSAPYPFTCKRFRTDGKRIFMEVVEETGDESLVDVERQQNVIQKVIGPSLREGVELDMQGEAARWFPLRGSRAIVFDPARKFGQPILAEFDVPTIAIVDAVRAEDGNERRVAKLYDLPLAAVRKAVEFESRVAPA